MGAFLAGAAAAAVGVVLLAAAAPEPPPPPEARGVMIDNAVGCPTTEGLAREMAGLNTTPNPDGCKMLGPDDWDAGQVYLRESRSEGMQLVRSPRFGVLWIRAGAARLDR